MMAQVLGFLLLRLETWVEFQVPGFDDTQPWLRSLSLSLCLSNNMGKYIFA